MARRIALFILVTAGLCLGGAAAWAHWGATTAAGAAGASVAATVNSATTPVASITAAQTVTLTWAPVTLSNGVAVDSYVVKRYNASTLITQTVGAGCASTITAVTCTEASVPVGSWRYSVYPRIGTNWLGTESSLTTPVVITAPALTLTRTVYNAAASTTGTLSGFGVNEAVSYRLDAATTLTGFPTVVDTTGGAPISSLAIPSASDGTHTVYAIGANGSLASTTITVDTVAPTVSASLSPAANGGGWNTTSPVQVTLTASDAGTGVAAVKYTTDGTDPTVSGTAITYTGPFNLAATATVRYFATDVAGNASAVGSKAVKIDTVAPANSLALTSVTGAALNGTTIYYRGTSTGSFTITNTVTDAGSGPASSATAALGGTSTGFTHTASTVGTPSGGPYVSNTFSWAASTSSAPTESVTGADVAGNTTATNLTFSNDSAGPTGGSVDASGLVGTGSRYSTSTSISVAFSKGADSGVGLAASGTLLQRAAGTLANGACTGYGTFATIATDPATSPYADTVPDQACYLYQYVVPDKLGNSTPYLSGDVKVDTTAPTAPTVGASALSNTYLSGGTLYYRSTGGTGSVTLTAASTDAASAIASYTFPTLGTNWISTPGATGVNTYSWTSTPAGSGAKSVVATNNATLTASTALTLTNDTAAPSGGSVTYNAGYQSSSSVSVTFTAGTDALSGVNATSGILQRNTAPMIAGVCQTYTGFTTIQNNPTSPYTDTTTANTCNQYQYLISDNVGNQQTYTNTNVLKAPHYYTCASAVGTPYLYWKLGDPGPTTAADSSGNGRTGTYTGGGFTFGVAGACLNGATFNGTSSYVTPTSGTAVSSPTTYTEELWFKTTTAGGKLIGFGSSQTGSSFTVDRHIYINTSGKLVFGVSDSFLSSATVTSTATVTDGVWHHVMATQSPAAGITMYLDGVSAGTPKPTATNPNVYNGYWRVGYDNLLLWPGVGSYYVNGQISNVAIYSTALTQADAWDHYIAGTLTSGALLTAPPSISAAVAQSGVAQSASVHQPAAKAASPSVSPYFSSPVAVPSSRPPLLSPSPSR